MIKRITLPEGFEVDFSKSTKDEIILKEVEKVEKPVEQKPKTWNEIQGWHRENGIKQYYLSFFGDIRTTTIVSTENSISNIPSEHIAQKIRALCQLHIIADFYNEGWKPDYKRNEQIKYFPYWDNYYEKLGIMCSGTGSDTIPDFKSKELLMKAYEHNKEIFETALKP